jgi:hypothetical protein
MKVLPLSRPNQIRSIYNIGPTSVTTSTEDAVDYKTVVPVTAEPDSIYPVYTVGPTSVTTTIDELPSVVALSATIMLSEGQGNGPPIPSTTPGNNTRAMIVGHEPTPSGLGMELLAGALLIKGFAGK